MKRSIVFFLLISSLFISTTFSQTTLKLTSETFSGLKLRGIGPALMGGRIADIEKKPPSILGRIFNIVGGHRNNTYGPTKTQQESYAFAVRKFDIVSEQLRTLIDESKKLEADMEAAGAPWKPGREIVK